MSYKKKEKKRPCIFLSTCWKSSVQHLGHSHKDHGLCSVNKVDHRGSKGNRLPCSVYASTVGWAHSFPDILGFYWQHKLQPLHWRCWRSESSSSVPCVQATMQLKHGKHCSSPLHLETGDPLYSPSNGTSPLKSSTFQVVAPFGAGVMKDAESIPTPLAGCSGQWCFTSLTAPSAETPVHGKASGGAPCLRVQLGRACGRGWSVLRQGNPRDHGPGQPMPTLWPWMNDDRTGAVRSTFAHGLDSPPIGSPKVWDRLSVTWNENIKNSDWEGGRIGIWVNLRLGEERYLLKCFLNCLCFLFLNIQITD